MEMRECMIFKVHLNDHPIKGTDLWHFYFKVIIIQNNFKIEQIIQLIGIELHSLRHLNPQ